MPGEDLKPTTPQQYVANSSFVARVSPKLVVRIRRSEPLELIFSGMLSLPMLQAAQNFEDIRDAFQSAETKEDREKNVEKLLGDDKNELVKFARDYACKMVIEPVITPELTDDPSHLWVQRLDFMELMAILNAEDPDQKGQVPDREKVEEFRRTEPESPDNASSAGENLRDEAKLVSGSPQRDFISA